MKKLKYILGFVLMTLGYSCTDFVDPAIPYNNFETGVFLRTITPPSNINFFALNTATFSLVLEAVDEEDGKLLEEVDIYVNRRRGNTLTTPVKVTTIPKSDFAPNPDSKYLRATISVPVSQALTAMGFTNADLAGGDFLEWRLDMLDSKGRRWTNTNVSTDIVSGTFYASPFFYRTSVVCPSDLAKTYNAVTDWIDCTGTPGTFSYTVNLVKTAGTLVRYDLPDLSGGMEPIVWSNAPVAAKIDDVCGKIVLNSAPYAYAYFIDGVGNSFGTGSNVNSVTGVITIYWINFYDEMGRTVLTPQ